MKVTKRHYTESMEYLSRIANKDFYKKLNKELARVKGMLSNERFVSKAPESKVAEEKAKLEKYTNMMEQVKERLKQLERR